MARSFRSISQPAFEIDRSDEAGYPNAKMVYNWLSGTVRRISWRTDLKEFFERASEEGGLSYRDLQIVLDALPTALSWATLENAEIRFFNRAFKTLFGYSDGAFRTVDDWIDTAYIDNRQKMEARSRWEQLWVGQPSGIGEVDVIELDIRCADGTIRTVQHRGILLHDIGIGIATFDDISDRKRAEQALFALANEDPLTGLPNRRVLQERWQETLRRHISPSSMSALLLIDLDGFKPINDQLGHDAGDEVLCIVAERLKASVRESDLICRIGGDEFVVLLGSIATHEIVAQLCWRIEASLNLPVAVAGNTVRVGASIGASLFPRDGTDLRSLIKRADEALYRVKAREKGGWEWFEAPTAALSLIHI